MDVIIKQMPALRLATAKHVGPYNRISEAFERLGKLAEPAGLITKETAMLGVYYDDPEVTPASELRSEAALVIAPTAVVPQGLGERTLAAGRYATTTHVGPYEQLGDAWGRFLGQWLAASGERMGEAAYELYRNTPADVPKDQLVTELYIHLE